MSELWSAGHRRVSAQQSPRRFVCSRGTASAAERAPARVAALVAKPARQPLVCSGSPAGNEPEDASPGRSGLGLAARFVWTALVGLLVVVGAGCPQQTAPEQEERPFEGLSLRVAVPSGLGLAERWSLLLDEWSEQTGATVDVVELPLHPGTLPPAQSLEQLKQSNLVFLPLSDVAAYAEAGLVAPLPASALTPARLDWNDVFRGLRVAVGSLEGQAAVVPLSCPTLVLYYRADLLEKAVGRPPRSWNEYRRLVENIQDWAPGHVAVEPWHPQFRATWFLARAAAYAQHPANYSLYFDIFTGEPLIDRPAFVQALNESLELLRFLPPEVLRYTPADCRRALLSGRAALAVAFEPSSDGEPLAFTPYDASSKQPAFQSTRRASRPPADSGQSAAEPADRADPATNQAPRPEGMRIGFCRLPGSERVYNNSIGRWQSPPERDRNEVALVGFGGLCAVVPPGDETVRDAACHLLTRLTLERFTEAFPPTARTLCRESQLGQAAGWLGPELTADERQRFVQCVGDTLRTVPVVAELPLVGAARFREALSDGLEAALSGQKPADQALKDVAARWKAIAEEIGVAKVRDSYRRRLGLPPRGR